MFISFNWQSIKNIMKEVPDFLLFQFVSRVSKLYYSFIAILQRINNLAKFVPYSQIILILLLYTN